MIAIFTLSSLLLDIGIVLNWIRLQRSFFFYIRVGIFICFCISLQLETYMKHRLFPETSQIHTGGILQATPHAVRGCDPNIEGCSGLSRETCAVFMEPE